ncbi:metallophosphoesterase family protein [Sorangium sp. So ce426]|uniref:metallophosphoesterase family protein n=1 Tax=unclassified Sorangium TaxID=2621164 RepID=UPI003F5C5D01
MKPLAVIGDVHGDARRLREMLDRLEPSERTMVFVGDYVDGAPHSAEVVEELICRSKREPRRYHFLAGNHDLALLRYLRGGDFAAFAKLGGVSTLHSYLGETRGDVHHAFIRAFPPEHRDFFERLNACWEEEEVLIAHAGFDPERPEIRSRDALAHGAGSRIFMAERFPRPLVVCGHYPQARGEPYQSTNLICIDTGCGMADGPLTALLLPERTFIAV